MAKSDSGGSANERLHLLWIACGTDDHLIALNRKMIAWLKSKDVSAIQIETPGMHTWMVWRRNLMAFAPLLFQNAAHDAAVSTAGAK
jgi:enterochelin esterase family protein